MRERDKRNQKLKKKTACIKRIKRIKPYILQSELASETKHARERRGSEEKWEAKEGTEHERKRQRDRGTERAFPFY